MKTTIEIEDRLLRASKRAALERHCSLRQLAESGLRRELAAPPASAREIAWVDAPGAWPENADFASREAMWRWIEDAPPAEP